MLFPVFLTLYTCVHLAIGSPLTIPIAEEWRSPFIEAFNKFRASLRSSNMESITEWSTDLEEDAQNNGALCKTTIEKGTAYVINNDLITPDNLASLLSKAKTNYATYKDTCSSSKNDGNCQSYKQITWYRGGKIGCALTKCDTTAIKNYTLTCVFQQKADLDQKLTYASGTPCTFCASSETCTSPNFLCVPVDAVAPSAPTYCGGSVPTQLIPLYRMVHKTTSATILTPEQNPTLATGFENKGLFGYVSSSADCKCNRLSPLIQMSASGVVDYVHVIGEEKVSYYSQKNYKFVRTLGFVVSSPGLCGSNATVHQFIRSSSYNYYTADEDEAKLMLQRTGSNTAYWFAGKPFAFWA
ncbi:SCP-like protein [Trichuris suis]|nr:SCP-like protein [Trichuris suis]